MKECQRTAIPIYIISFLVVLIYSNTLGVPWLFDDFHTIFHNTALHLTSLTPDSIWGTFFSNSNSPDYPYRPVSCLSFALNWLIGQDTPAGYHMVNIVIHALSAIFIFKCCLLIFKSPILINRFSPSERLSIALLSAALWAANPIQTQAVTYIVQRMASLAGMFCVVSLYFFLKARLAQNPCIYKYTPLPDILSFRTWGQGKCSFASFQFFAL